MKDELQAPLPNPPDNKQSPSQAENQPTPLQYDEIKDYGTHVTGFAHYNNPNGLGTFEIRVSGQRESIEAYRRQAAIVEMAFGPVTDDLLDSLRAQENTLLDEQREYWHQQLEALQRAIYRADLDTLSDPQKVWELRPAADKPVVKELPPPDFTVELLVEIEPTSPRNGELPHYLSFILDPFIGFQETRRYASVSLNTKQVLARLDPTRPANVAAANWVVGDPNLSLYRNGSYATGSYNGAGSIDFVSRSGEAGNWQIQVYGSSASHYLLGVNWVESL